MALDISGATFGVDANGIQSFINELNTKCIADTISKMNSGLSDLRSAVDSAWVGTSAETYKNNLEADKKTITDALNESFEVLKGELNDIASKIGEVDEGLIQGR